MHATREYLSKMVGPSTKYHGSYAEARNWDELWGAVILNEIRLRSSLDELLFLQDEAHGKVSNIRGLKTIRYRELGPTLDSLRTTASGGPANLKVNLHSDRYLTEQHTICEYSIFDPLSSGIIRIDMSQYSEKHTKAAVTIQRVYRQFVIERRDRAATIIQKAYRQYRAGVNALIQPPMGSIDESRQRLRKECSDLCRRLPAGTYKEYYIGRLPHALLCLDRMNKYVFKRLERTRKYLKTGRSVVLEKVVDDIQADG